jgi:RNA polymerase sigma factor (sigma-70 family)
MATGRTDALMRQLRRAALLGGGGALTDRQLLERFLRCRDEAAFEALMQRHGPMVLGVCRRVLGNGHDAEDAFQATFLVLVRNAGRVRRPDSLGSWLYGVAYRTALEARTAAARRRKKERQVAHMAGHRPPEGDTGGELREVLDHELAKLPEIYRAAVVLCELEGKSHREAARQLGCPEGTVTGRLARARKLLARRLAGHGIPLAVGGLGTVLARPAFTAPVPRALAGSTLKAAVATAAGHAAAVGVVSVSVISLTEGVLKAMFLSKLKAMFPAVLAAAVLVGGLTVAAFRNEAAGQPPSPPVNPPPPLPNQPQQGPVELLGGGGTAQLGKLQLPTGHAPVQAIASMAKDGRVVLRMAAPDTAVTRSLDVVRQGDVVQTTATFQTNQETTTAYRRGEVRVFDVHGREVDWAFLPKLLGKEVLALAAVGERVDPLHLRLIKEGTLVFVIPHPKQPGTSGRELGTGTADQPGVRPADGATKTPPGGSGLLGPRDEPPAGGPPGSVVPPTRRPPVVGSPPPTRGGQVTPPPDVPAPGDAPKPPPTRVTPPAPPPRDTKPDSGDRDRFRPAEEPRRH